MNEEEINRLAKLYATWPKEQLLDTVRNHTTEYDPKAIGLIIAELQYRGIQLDNVNVTHTKAPSRTVPSRTKLKRYLIGGLALFLWAFRILSMKIPHEANPATDIFLLLSAYGFILPLAGLIFQQCGKIFLVATLLLRLMLLIPWFYSLTAWCGGDDGGGMIWMFTLGPACLASFLLACRNLIILKRIT